MSMTKEEIERVIAKRLKARADVSYTWSDVVAAAQGLTPDQRSEAVEYLKKHNYERFGRMFHLALKERDNASYLAEAATMLANDTLSLTEIERIL